MKYLDALNERNKENQARKNLVMNRPTEPTNKPGRHSTDGKDRGRKPKPPQKVRGVKIRPGDTADVTTGGRTEQTTASNRLVGRNRPTADLTLKLNTAGPKGKIPGPKPGQKPELDNSHTEYKRMGIMMAEALGYRVDEFVPALLRVGSGIVRGVGAAARTVGGVTKNVALNMAKKRAKKKAMQKAQQMANGDDQNQMEAYKQIGRMISEVLSPKKHAEDTGGGKKAEKTRAERMRAVMRGRGISPIAGVEAVDKPGVTLSRAAKTYRAARDSGDPERPKNLKPSYSK